MTSFRFATSLALVLVVLSSGCKSRKAAPAAETAPRPQAKASADPLEPVAAPAASVGPAPSGLLRIAREQAVVSLLRGQIASERMPEIATDDGGVVDPKLRDVLAPRNVTVTRPLRPAPSAGPPAPVGLGDL